MGKFAALAILLTVAAVIYFINPGVRVEVPKPSAIQLIQQDDTEIIKIEKTTSPEIKNSISNDLTNSHQHIDGETESSSEKDIVIPQYIKDALEAKRIPASELTVEHHTDGSSTIDLKGQFQHVPVAVIGKDGKAVVIETRITPVEN